MSGKSSELGSDDEPSNSLVSEANYHFVENPTIKIFFEEGDSSNTEKEAKGKSKGTGKRKEKGKGEGKYNGKSNVSASVEYVKDRFGKTVKLLFTDSETVVSQIEANEVYKNFSSKQRYLRF